jgi:hypothetical protein
MGLSVRGGTVAGFRTIIYQGPGDIVGGAAYWVGLRAYSSAAIGTNAIRLRESGGNTEQDFVTIAGGGLDLSAIATFKGANSLFVVKLYDQTGNGFDQVQATAANQPAFTLSGLGSLPVLGFSRAAPHFLTVATGPTTSHPGTLVAVANRTIDPGAQSFMAEMNTQFQSLVPATAIMQFYDGSTQGATLTTGTFFSWIGLFTGNASATLYQNGTSVVTGDVGNSAVGNGVAAIGALHAGSQGFDGNIQEVGYWASGFTSGQASSMSTNQSVYWGY